MRREGLKGLGGWEDAGDGRAGDLFEPSAGNSDAEAFVEFSDTTVADG